MDPLKLKRSFKTDVLNFFRRWLISSKLDKDLAERLKHNRSFFLEKVIPPNYLYPAGHMVSVERKGINYRLDLNCYVDHLIYYGLEDSEFEPVINSIREAKTIIDIGGNIGRTTLEFATENKTGTIYSIEPHPGNFKRLSENIGLNSFPNIQAFNIGFGSQPGTALMAELDSANPGMNRITTDAQGYPTKEIQIETLDNFVQKQGISRIDFIKMDVEGFEYFVLQGGKNALKASYPVLFMELDDRLLREQGQSSKALLQLLQELGYTQFLRADTDEKVTVDHDFATHCHFDLIARR